MKKSTSDSEEEKVTFAWVSSIFLCLYSLVNLHWFYIQRNFLAFQKRLKLNKVGSGNVSHVVEKVLSPTRYVLFFSFMILFWILWSESSPDVCGVTATVILQKKLRSTYTDDLPKLRCVNSCYLYIMVCWQGYLRPGKFLIPWGGHEAEDIVLREWFAILNDFDIK